MSDPLTIDAACLELLGGLQKCDSAALWFPLDDGHDHPQSRRPLAIHPLLAPVPRVGRVLVPQSDGALLRVLSRHLGWEGVGRPLLHREYGGKDRSYVWALCCLESQGGRTEVESLLEWLPAHISTGLTYHEALAAAVTWFARLARALDEAGTAILPDGVTVADVEDEHDLPPLKVRP